ncbi:type III PLP-dependent enzyme [Roseovarius autotrophicus]|uniref:type III PLP-dependent enzyme n=1 Tax=Roseovarius autotrophicus TaxID=2824121 RepID=UPI0019E729D1|nr:type III PLP-dependent enzyme [Roseovarius autotrophicus]MBE0453273.1 type III PLP-dependent enzyme [Roseovarius sp.]
MQRAETWSDPIAHLTRQAPDAPVLYFSPDRLQATARAFQTGFPGLVTYAVKANPGEEVLANLVAAGIRAFDVASPEEMGAVRALCPDAVLHYHNPVRSPDEVAVAARMGVRAFSVDCVRELDKLTGRVAPGSEMSVRLALQVRGAAYDFGEKFGLGPEGTAALLQEVAARGFAPSLTFHPGTQCADPAAWGAYIGVAAEVAHKAGVRLRRLNVGGGFASHRTGQAPDLTPIFTQIGAEVARHFGTRPPALVCEPGRAMVAEAFTLGLRVKAMRASGAVFLNDGVYGSLTEVRDIGAPDRLRVIAPDGTERRGAPMPRVVFGPTCDSIDRLPDPLPLPGDMAEGDHVLIAGMGAYTRCLATGFNGYGLRDLVTVSRL